MAVTTGTALLISGALGAATAVATRKKPPEFKPAPTIDPAEERRRFAERAALARRGASGTGGLGGTNRTGPQGLATAVSGGSVKGTKTALGQ